MDPAELASRLPAGTGPDVHDGSGWATVLAMRMERVHPRLVPSMPGVSAFSQVALRAFVHCEATDEPVSCSWRSTSRTGSWRAWAAGCSGSPTSDGRSPRLRARCRASASPRSGRALADEEEDDLFFAERDVLFSWSFGRLHRSLVSHPPVTFVHAEVGDGIPEALATAGLAAVGPPRSTGHGAAAEQGQPASSGPTRLTPGDAHEPGTRGARPRGRAPRSAWACSAT